MAAFGTLTLLIALVVATYGGVASVVGVRRNNARLIESGRAAAYALAAVLAMASVTIMYAFLTHDFSIKYVQRTSDVATPVFYKITAYWGGLDGSILWWVFLLSVFSAIAIYTNRNRHREILPYAVAVLMAIADFFLFLIIFHKNPFDTYMTSVPTRGEGLNPLLQNAYMITHPPSLYTGFVGMSIPYAFAMGALISGHLDDAWIAAVRRWTLIAWFFLALGLTLGMLWAYEELGWGGFWAWDPVENAGFLPWLTATAFFHSTMIQERRGMMKVWNFSLVILTFMLTIFGTYLTRSGVVQSVHAFGEDKKLATFFTTFMLILLVVSFGLLIKRLPRAAGPGPAGIGAVARSRLPDQQLDPAGGDVLRPVRHHVPHAVRGDHRGAHQRRSAVLQQVDGAHRAGAGVPDRRGPADRLAQGHPLAPASTSSPGRRRPPRVAVAVCVAMGLHRESIASIICFAFCAFTATTVFQEFGRGAAIRRRNTGSDYMTAVLGMIIRGRRRYGGYIVHLGVVLMFVGFAGQAFQKEEELHLRPRPGRPLRQIRRPLRSPAARGRSPEGDADRRLHHLRPRRGHQEGRQDPGADAPGALVLQRAQRRVHHRGGHQPGAERGPVPHPGRGRLLRRVRRRSRWWSTRWSTGSGWGSSCWPSAPASP